MILGSIDFGFFNRNAVFLADGKAVDGASVTGVKFDTTTFSLQLHLSIDLLDAIVSSGFPVTNWRCEIKSGKLLPTTAFHRA